MLEKILANQRKAEARAKRRRMLVSAWLPVVVAMGLIFYGSSRPDGARRIVQPLRAAIVQALGGGARHGRA